MSFMDIPLKISSRNINKMCKIVIMKAQNRPKLNSYIYHTTKNCFYEYANWKNLRDIQAILLLDQISFNSFKFLEVNKLVFTLE